MYRTPSPPSATPASPFAATAPAGSTDLTARDIARIVRRRAPLAITTFLVVLGATAAFTMQMPKLYQAQARVLMENNTAAAMPSSILGLLGGGSDGSPLETEIEKIRSRAFLQKLIDNTHPLAPTNPEDMRGRLLLGIGPNNQILDISARAKTAEEAQALANNAARLYIAQARQDFEDKTDESQQRLRKAAAIAKVEKEHAERELTLFMAKVGQAEPGILYDARERKTVEVKNNLEEARKNLGLLQKQLNVYETQAKTIPPTIVTGFGQIKNPIIEGYQVDLVNLGVQRTKLLEDFLPSSLEVQTIDTEIRAKQTALAQAEKTLYAKGSVNIARNPDYSKAQSSVYDTQAALKNTRSAVSAGKTQLAALETEQRVLAQQKNVYEGLRRTQGAAVDAYQRAKNGLLQMEPTRITSAPHFRILDEAILPWEPVSPKPLMNAIMAVFLGLFLAVSMAIVAEYFAATTDKGEPEPDDLFGLPQIGGVPLLGHVPVASLPSPSGAAHHVPANFRGIEDAVREIGYVLAHRAAAAPVPVVLLSGTRSDESTAALSAQLAATLSRDGLRVTLVDADRAHPRLNRVFGAPDAPGVADVLAGRIPVKDALHIGGDGILRFLAAGSLSDDTPTTEESARSLFTDLSRPDDTDIVIVSGPSVWSVRALAPLEKAASGMVLLASDETSPEESVARARRMLSNGYRPRLLGVVVNQSGDGGDIKQLPDASTAAIPMGGPASPAA